MSFRSVGSVWHGDDDPGHGLDEHAASNDGDHTDGELCRTKPTNPIVLKPKVAW